MNESRELKERRSAGRVASADRADAGRTGPERPDYRELKMQLDESLTLNEKLNSENRAGNIQALKNDLRKTKELLQSEKEKLRSANVMIEECQDKIRCKNRNGIMPRTHQKNVEIPVEKPVLYEKCEACNRTAYLNAKGKV